VAAAQAGLLATGSGAVWSRPNFLRNLNRAMRETRMPKVASMKSMRSARLASGFWKKWAG
jgi:hypothetical protein